MEIFFEQMIRERRNLIEVFYERPVRVVNDALPLLIRNPGNVSEVVSTKQEMGKLFKCLFAFSSYDYVNPFSPKRFLPGQPSGMYPSKDDCRRRITSFDLHSQFIRAATVQR